MHTENKISKHNNVLIAFTTDKEPSEELKYLLDHFCGTSVDGFAAIKDASQKVFVCGNLSSLDNQNRPFYIIKEVSENYEHLQDALVVSLGEVPVIIHEVGVYFRKLFHEHDDYFHQIRSQHEFQQLTESNKQSNALRTGIYLSDVSKETTNKGNEQLHFHLLRCSSNLSGPTDNFRKTDRSIISTLNAAAKTVFEEETSLNHVLAQIYENRKDTDERAKERKAKIKAHSDKTKDMAKNGLIAFCTFYDNTQLEHLKPSKTDRYDWCHGKTSGLTRLHFKLKKSVIDDRLEKEFSVTLYPNSAFIIPLSTNRLYTHEIRPSLLNIARIPTRMGYVVRCSNLEAVFMNDETYIKENGELIKLEEMTNETMSELRDTYYEENVSERKVTYGKVHFSMNGGDYQKPIY
ncbi:hypothetical protein U8527_05415 [Kordia algicida OT-1]|uniref:Uncharacterized protein n=1 Tax=Kordia algicida OT-1 TaxID=391587 RepID=A9DMQ6_9FLAO|nr:hypothetical protein [Kordia algicida]EDP97763.1 hypothetical protein KAOT1_21412 [Kordia algicida OT-1]